MSASSNGLGFLAEKKFFRGKIFVHKEFSKEWSFRKRGDPTSFGKVYDYSFDVKKIRMPIK